MHQQVIVIGAGIGGLSAAALMAKQGYRVTVLEKNDTIGGRAMVWEQNGYRFDMGPSWYHMPEVFEKFFGTFGKKVSDYYKLVTLDPQYQVFFSSSEQYTIRKHLLDNLNLFETIEPGCSDNIQHYLGIAKEQYELSMKHVLYRNLSNLQNICNPHLIWQLRKFLVKQSLLSFVQKFVKDKRLQQLLTYNILFIGGDPRTVPALFSLMAHVDLNLGVHYPVGGFGAVVKGFARLAGEQGAIIKTDEEVIKVQSQGKQAKKITTTKQTYDADIVISNADIPFTEMVLLEETDRTYPKPYWDKRVIAPSAFVLYIGLNKKLKNAEHHNLYLSPNWEEHFDSLFKTHTWPEDPSYYASVVTKTDSSQAPNECDSLFVTVQVSNRVDDSYDNRRRYAKKIIHHLESLLKEDIYNHIVVEQTICKSDYQSLYHAYHGTAIGLATTTFQSLFRPGNKSKKLDNLYYVGQYTSPGIGMPMVVIGAQNTVERISKVIS